MRTVIHFLFWSLVVLPLNARAQNDGGIAVTSEPDATAPAEADLTIAEIAKKAGVGVVSLRTYGHDGRELGLGSGFLVEGGRIVTNAHVVEGATRVEVFDSEGNLLGSTDHAEALSSRTDLAVLPAMPHPPAALELAVEEPDVGDAIVAIGSPQGLTNTVSAGIVSAFRDNEGVRWMQISAPISQGSSGGPILDKRARVVAVSVAVLREGQNLNFAIPVRNVEALVRSPRGRIAFSSGVVETNAAKRESDEDQPRRATRQSTAEFYRGLPKLELGSVVDGSLEEGDLALEDGKFIDAYSFEGRAGEEFTILANSSVFDVTLTVFDVDADGKAASLAHDDDGGSGTNSRAVVRVRRNGPLAVFVSSAEAGERGAYRLGRGRGKLGGASSSKADTGRWTLVSQSEKAKISIDRQTLQRFRSGRTRAWQWVEYDEWQSGADGTRYDSVRALEEFDCTRKRARLIALAFYAGETVVSSTELNRPGDWNYWIPGSVGENVGAAVCGK